MRKNFVILLAFGLTNFTSLVYEVAWTRELTYIFGTSVYAVSTALTSFMAGLALGSFLLGRIVDRYANRLRLFAILEMGLGSYGIATVAIFSLLNFPFFFFHNLLGHGIDLHLAKFFLTFIVLLIPTTLLGGLFPVVGRIYSLDFITLGRQVGKVYTADTLGAASGSFISGFLMLPLLGLDKTIFLAGTVNILLGVLIYNLAWEEEK